MPNLEPITHKATCFVCQQELVGGKRQQGNHERVSWVHAVRSDELKNGLHGAFPAKDSIVEI